MDLLSLGNGLYKRPEANDPRVWTKENGQYKIYSYGVNEEKPEGVINASISVKYGTVKENGRQIGKMLFTGDIIAESSSGKAWLLEGEAGPLTSFSSHKSAYKCRMWIPKKAVEIDRRNDGPATGYKAKPWFKNAKTF